MSLPCCCLSPPPERVGPARPAGPAPLGKNFMTLEEAKNELEPNVWDDIAESKVWDSVVQIVVPKENGKRGYGTGCVFQALSSKYVLTNHHVVREHSKGKGPILVKFFYNSPTSPGEKCEVDEDIKYYSRCPDEKQGDKSDEEYYDFAVLGVKNMPQNIKPITLMACEGRHKSLFSSVFTKACKDLGINLGQGLIVGHPQGEHKRISIVDFVVRDDDEGCDDVIREYSKEGTRPGSSGSPVFLNAKNEAFAPHWVCALHFQKKNGAGRGVSILKVIEHIRKCEVKKTEVKKTERTELS